MFQEEQDPVELGSSNNIKASATSGLYHILEKITLEFSKDGQKLTFIDNHVVHTNCLTDSLRDRSNYSTRIVRQARQ